MMSASSPHQTVERTRLQVRETARKYDALLQRERAPTPTPTTPTTTTPTTTTASRAVETHALHRVSDLRARFEGVQGPLPMRRVAASPAPSSTRASRRFDVYGKTRIDLHEQVATPSPIADEATSDVHEHEHEHEHDDVARADDVGGDAEHVGSASNTQATTTTTAAAAAAATSADQTTAAHTDTIAVAAAATRLVLALQAGWTLLLWLGWALTPARLAAMGAARVSFAGMRLLLLILLILFAGAQWFACFTLSLTRKTWSACATEQVVPGAKTIPTLRTDPETETETESDHDTELTLQLEYDAAQAQVASWSLEATAELALELVADEVSELALEFVTEAMSELALELETEIDTKIETEIEIEATAKLSLELVADEVSELALEFVIEAMSELALELETETETETETEIKIEATAKLSLELVADDVSELALEFVIEAMSELALELETKIETEIETEIEAEAEPIADHSTTIESTLALDVQMETAPTTTTLPKLSDLTLEPESVIESASAVRADTRAANLVAKAPKGKTVRAVAPAPSPALALALASASKTSGIRTAKPTQRTRRRHHRAMVHHGNPYDTDADSKYLLYETASTAYERRKAAAAAQRTALGAMAMTKSSWR